MHKRSPNKAASTPKPMSMSHEERDEAEMDMEMGKGARVGALSRKKPVKDLRAKDVVVEAGLPKDRLKGYREDITMFTGADARVALVGQYKKKNKKGFTTHSSKAKTYGSSGY